MRICQLPNFEKDLHSGDINFSTLQGENLEEVLQNIETALEGVPFSVSLDSSTDVDNYQSSIKSLIDTIIEKLGKKELPFTLNRSAKTQIRKYFEGKFLPKPLTPVEQNIVAVIAGTDLITEDERRSMRLSQTLREVYGDNEAINTFRQSLFDEEMRIRTIIDTGNRQIIDNPNDLNRGIIKYQSEQFKVIRDFLVQNGFDTKLLPQSLYREDSATQVPNLVRTYTNALQMMYNLIESKKAKGTLSAELEEGWVSAITGKGDPSLYNAVNAYVNLAYFDDILKECFGDYIKINQDFDQPITIETNNGISNIVYKYLFEKGNANATKTWGVEEHDSLKEMSKFQQVLIKSIPIYDYETRSIEYGRLQPKDFVGSFSRLMDVGAQVVGDLEFTQAVNTLQDHPTTSLEIIFKKLFENRNNKTLLSSLEDLGLDQNNINYLYSVYRTVFKGKDSWKSIEEDYIRDRGLTSRYFLVDTLLGVIDSNVAMNYANTTFNHDTGEAETSVKARYSANRTKFDIVNNVNSTTIDRENKGELLSRYEISTQNKKDYTITLNNSGTPRTFTITVAQNGGLLDKGDYSKALTINGILNLTNVDIASRDNRDKLISRQGLTQDEETLMSVLDFIDTMLGTYFSRDVDGLRELNLLLRVKKDNLKEMFASASRALLVTDLYNKFDTSLNSKGERYARTELLTYLSESGEYADKIQDYNDKRKREYFIKRFDGYQLSSLRGNQRWIDDLAKVRAILSGDTSKSVIANLDGDKIPNFGPGFLGARIEQQLTRSNNLGLATSNLLFVQNPTAIKAKVVNTDVITKDGLKKQVKGMTQGELLYDAIVNKFIVPYTKNRCVFTQPTTFSDKTKFVLYQVSLESLGLDDISGANFNENVERQVINTIGQAYKEVYGHVIEDYMKIFPEFINSKDGQLNLDAVQNWLKAHKENDFTAKALAAGVSVYKDVHYRQIIGKNLSINELLYEYATNLYTPENLHNRLEYEKVNFINDLLSNRLSFEISLNDSGELDYVNGNDVTKFLKNMLGSSVGKSWVRGNKMIFAKIKSKNGRVRNVTYGKISLSPDETFIINPVLNAFFMLDNLIGNNLRYSLTGSEINHKVKALAKLDLGKKGMNLHKDFISKYYPGYNGGAITFYDAMIALRNFEQVGEESDRSAAQAVRKIYNEQIYKIENGAQNAQFKRNVIIPGTMRYYLQGRLNGIRDRMKVAVINDMGANVFNFDGKADGIDAHDGSAFVNPFSSILENWSLQDCEVGTVKKPIQHWYDDRYMSATLLKYAVDTITNRWMLQAEGNDPRGKHHGVVLRNVFKKMTNVRWHNPDGSWKFGPIDLIEGCDYRSNPRIDFFKNILEGKSLYYRDGLRHKKVADFGVENGVYFTIEQDVDSMGLEPTNQQKIYHYFTNSGEHVRSLEMLNPTPDLHTIDSLFELHTALGGIYSESVDDEGNLQFSEASNYAVAQFINNVATLKEGADPNNLTQDSYYQPLKQAMIDVLANNSAVKNGAGNMNPTSSFYDDTALSYIEIGTNGYGIQMDADHTADEGHMTEFSQVISSLDAGGRLHGYVSQIYETLGKLAVDLSQIEIDSIENFRETGNLSQVYDIVGRTIMNNLSKNRGQAGLANAIIDNIKERFNLNTDHALDEFKIPFSDPNIYSTILSTFVSVINKKSIKRQYPGLGTVMVPGYNISMIYDVDGKTYQYEDLIRMAINAGFTSDFTDLSMKNKDIVQKFLQAKQNELPMYTSQEIFQPTDNVRISYNSDVSGTGIIEVSLDNIEDYYLFKDDIVAFLNGKGIVNPTNITYQKNITVPRNLAPVKISWEYDDETGHHVMNIFDHWAIKGSYHGKRDVEAIQKAFDDLQNGIYIDQNGVKHQVQNLQNTAAELIMSNLYKSKFGLRNGDTLSDVIDQGVDYFKRPVTPIMSDSYDLVYTKQDNRNLYITFKPLHDNDENFDSTKRAWKNKIKREFTYPPEYQGERTIINRVYTATNDNIPLFEVGREILRKDVQYDTVKRKFVDQTGKVLPNQSRFTRLGEDQVIEYIEFISNNQVTEIREKTSKYDLYNINRDQIKKVLLQMEYTEDQLTRTDKETGETYTITPEQKFDEEINSFISHLLADVYHTRDFNGMQINQEVSVSSAYILRSSLYQLGEQLKYDADLSSYIKEGLYGMVKSGKAEDGVVKYSNRVRNRILNQYHEKLAQKQYTSFMKSQEFTVSRIPAQTLQSFMQMRNVGFTGTPTNQCFVSHWQTWLQGSDYDIDKAYIMGLSFDGNGRYVGWSNLFDYSSLETIKASEYLPMPKKKVYEVTPSGSNIDSFIVNILGATDAVARINGYVELLNYLNDNNITQINYTVPEGAEVVQAIRTHEFTKVPYSLQEEASKNFISSHIQNTVQNLRNMIGAYSPIEMEAFRAASEKSPKGEQASKMTLLNPSTKLLMQYQNITGKNVIGIAANGEKASFMWHYYINDVLRNPTPEKVRYSQFSFVTTRLQGRNSGNIQPQEVNTLPDVNFEGVNPELMAQYGVKMSGDITVDLMISQILSAATDNAKELILAKVNAGMKLAKMYLFLVTLGFDINDIVKFMTSPAITFIDAITEANIFTGQDLSIQDAIKVARGDFDNYYKSFLSTRTLGQLSKEDKNKLKRGELIENNFSEGSKEYIELTNALDAIAEVKDLLEQIIDQASEGKESVREEIVNNIPLDIDEFENILEGANEFSNLGKILGLNQGLPTSKALLQKRIQDMQKILSDRIKAVNAENQKRAKTEKGFKYEEIEDIPLDVKRYLTDAEYAQSIKDLYESVKKCINIFDIIDHIPQFNSIFKIFSAVLDIDHNISIKTRAYDSVYDQLKLEKRYMSEQYQTRLLKGIDDAIIAKFVNNSGISIPYSGGTNMLNELRQVVEAKEDGLLTFDSLSDVASFKYLFENSIIPNLKRGIVLDYQNGQVIQIIDESLKSNKFIQSLIKGDHRGMPLYKCDLDMLTTENSQNSKIKFQDYIKGLQALQKTKINGIALSDLFVLYNLVVNKNQYGSDRMTTLFDQFIQNNGQLSLIRKYLNYVGELDYSGKIEELNINILDLMKAAAAIVNSEIGQKDPTIIINTDSGPELRIKSGREYVKWQEIVPQVPGESQDEYLNRIYNHNSYFVLGGSYSDAVDRQVQNLRVITNQTLDTLNNLIRQGALTIYKVCQ